MHVALFHTPPKTMPFANRLDLHAHFYARQSSSSNQSPTQPGLVLTARVLSTPTEYKCCKQIDMWLPPCLLKPSCCAVIVLCVLLDANLHYSSYCPAPLLYRHLCGPSASDVKGASPTDYRHFTHYSLPPYLMPLRCTNPNFPLEDPL